jgi:cytochrome c nitrite reductase small subunit
MREALIIIAGLLLGSAVGVGGFTFVYAKGGSYLTDDPNACANCHVMEEQLSGWMKGSHRSAAVCNDCHTPEGFLNKYVTKAINGWHHSKAFTSGDFHEPIQIGPRNRSITEAACRQCHRAMTELIDADGSIECLRCHSEVGHR